MSGRVEWLWDVIREHIAQTPPRGESDVEAAERFMSRARASTPSLPAEHGDTPDLTEQIAAVLHEHGADYIVGANRCLCGAVIHDDAQFQAHLAAVLAGHLSARSAATSDTNEVRPRCSQCGPGYRLGDDGCRHTTTAWAATPDTAAQALREAAQAEPDQCAGDWNGTTCDRCKVVAQRLRARADRLDCVAPVQPVTDQKDDR